MKKIVVGGIEIPLGKFHPCLVYNKNLDCLQVILRDCSKNEVMITRPFDILRDLHPRKNRGTFAGFQLWGVSGMLHDQGYEKPSISLEDLIERFDRAHNLPYGASIFCGYKEKILEVARENHFEWWIPQNS